jgi:hypothetical protein
LEFSDSREQGAVYPPGHFSQLFLAGIEATLVLVVYPSFNVLCLLGASKNMGCRLLHFDLASLLFLWICVLKVSQVEHDGHAELSGDRAVFKVITVYLDRLE